MLGGSFSLELELSQDSFVLYGQAEVSDSFGAESFTGAPGHPSAELLWL